MLQYSYLYIFISSVQYFFLMLVPSNVLSQFVVNRKSLQKKRKMAAFMNIFIILERMYVLCLSGFQIVFMVKGK